MFNIIRLGISILLSGLLMSSLSWAQSNQYKRKKPAVSKAKGKKGQAAKKDKSDKIDIKDLEQKYWSPKDTDYTVVQNRSYTKAKRYSISLSVGPEMRNTFNTGLNYSLTANYFFSERHGIELNYTHADLYNSKATDTFLNEVGKVGGVQPDFGRVTSYMGLSYNFVPFYAKMSLLGRKIMYFDMVFSPGIGLTNYNQLSQESASLKTTRETGQSALTFSFDVSQYFFLTKHIALRFDLKNRWFREDVLAYKSGQKLRDQTTHTQILLFGINYLF